MKTIQNLKENYWLIGILFLGAILRFYKLDFQSIWLDEIHTMNEVNPKLSISEVYQSIMTSEQMPPLYFYSIYFFFKLFGYTSFVARLFSVLTGVLSLYAIYLLGKEMVDRKTGIIASGILCLNMFHLFYSQEARPYELLMLVSIFSFLRIVKFIKSPTTINAVFYGVSVGLMLLTHFFGLFVLLSQITILLVFFINTDKKNRIKFFLNSLLSGIIATVLFIPAFSIFIKVTEIKEFWIPPTTIDTIKQIFKDFCGNSDAILILSIIAICYFTVVYIKNKKQFKEKSSLVQNKYLLSGTVLFLWIIVVLFVTIARSYLVIPMIISRYFIVILPALILMVSIAICAFGKQKIGLSFFILFMIVSFYEITFHSHYYTRISKEQFREGTNFIKANNINHEPVVSSLGWYLPFFLKNDVDNYEIVDKPLEAYMSEIKSDTTKIKAFWYFDAFGRQYKPSQEDQKFIDTKFFIENNFDGFQAWAKHFILKSNATAEINISDFLPLKATNGSPIKSWIDGYKEEDKSIELFGWAYLEGQDDVNSRMSIILINNNKAQKVFSMEKVLRTDITDSVNRKFNLDNTGFKATIDKTSLPKGSYEIGILIEDNITKKRGLVFTGKKFSI